MQTTKSQSAGARTQRDESLTGMVIQGFRVTEATDIEMVKKAICMAIVHGSVGATEQMEECAGPEVLNRRYATVTRI